MPGEIAATGRRSRLKLTDWGFAAGVVLLVLLPQWMNPYLMIRHDSLLHTSIANGVLVGGIPPTNLLLAGEPLVYPWLQDALIAALSAATAILPMDIWPVWNSILAACLVLTMAAITRSVGLSNRTAFSTSMLGFLGINALGLFFGVARSDLLFQHGDVLTVVRAMTWHTDARLAGLVTKYWVASPFPLAILLYLSTIRITMRFLELVPGKPMVRSSVALALLFALLTALGGTQIVVFGATCVAVPLAATLTILKRKQNSLKHCFRTLVNLWLPFMAAALLVLSWQVPLRFSAPFSEVDIPAGAAGSHWLLFLGNITIPLLLPSALVLVGILKFDLHQEKKDVWTFFIALATCCAALSFFHLPGHNEYKLIYLAGLALAFPAAQSLVQFWNLHRVGAAFLIVLCLMSALLLAIAYIRVSPKYSYTSDELDLGNWIAHHTPPDAVFAEWPGTQYQIIPVLGQRSVLVGFTHALTLWGYDPKEIALRAHLARSLIMKPDAHLATSIGVRYVLLDSSSAAGKTLPAGLRTVYRNRTYMVIEVSDQ